MDLGQTLVNALVVGAVGAILAFMVHGLRKEVREEIHALRTEMREEIQSLRTEMREELRAMRSDLTQVALAVGAQPRAGEG